MSVNTFVAILTCLCGNQPTMIDKQECADPYIQCAVPYTNKGQLMSKKDFADKCFLKGKHTPAEQKCLNE